MATNPKMKPCPKCGLTDFLGIYDYDGARYVECNNGFNSTPTPPAKEPCYYRSYPAATSARYAIKFHNEAVDRKRASAAQPASEAGKLSTDEVTS